MTEKELIEKFIEQNKEEFENFCKEQKNEKFIPKNGEKYWFVDTQGKVCNWQSANEYEHDFTLNTTCVFRTEKEAEKYREFLADIYSLKKEFVNGKMDYCFYYNYRSKKLLIDYYFYSKHQGFCFTKENIEKLLNKYGEEYIKNYLLNVWE